MSHVPFDPRWVPATPPSPVVSKPESPAPFLEHLTVPLADIANIGPPKTRLDITLNADYLRIVTDFPVVVELDGKVVTGSGMGTSYRPDFVADDPTDNAGALLAPCVDFEVFTSFKVLSLSLQDALVAGSDEATEDVWGQVEIYYGKGPVRAHGPGWPVSFTMEYQQVRAAAPSISTDPLWPTISSGVFPGAGNNIAAPSGTRYFPHRLQITGWSFTIGWSGPIGAANVCRIGLRNEVATRQGGLWVRIPRDDGFGNDPTVYEWDFPTPVEVPGYVLRPDIGAAGGGLILQVEASANMVSVTHALTMRGWI